MVNVPVPVFSAPSVAVQVTMVIPTGNNEPGAGSHDRLETELLSLAEIPDDVDTVPSGEYALSAVAFSTG